MNSLGYILCAGLGTVFFISAAALMFVKPRWNHSASYSLSQRVLNMAPPMFAALFFLRLFACDPGSRLGWAVPDSMLNALRTFLADGDVHVRILADCAGERLRASGLGSAAGAGAAILTAEEIILDLGAPLLTLSAVLEVLGQLFPKLRIMLRPGCEKMVFSELNEETVILAESIKRSRGKDCPMLIVTDVYSSGEEEAWSELMERMKSIGGLCLKDDLSGLRLSSASKVTYILADTDRMKNLTAALGLARSFSEDTDRLRWDNSVYYFSSTDEGEELISKLSFGIAGQVREKNTALSERRKLRIPFFVPIKEYKNSIYRLMDDLPLFTPLIGKDRRTLNAAVFGAGRTGMEAFLAATWCGQLLDIRLNLALISNESIAELRQKLDRISPELLETTGSDRFIDPYFSLTLISSDLDTDCTDRLFALDPGEDSDTVKHFGRDCPPLSEFDYFIVTLGSDSRNLSTAYDLRCSVERASLDKHRDEQAIIAASIYSADLAEAAVYEDNRVKLVPFNTSEERFSYDNVINKRFRGAAVSISELYSGRTASAYSQKDMEDIFGKRLGAYSHYKYWTNIARGLHLKAMMFSAGITDPRDPSQKKRLAQLLRDDKLCDRLAWLEHRRWCAFLRTMGYVYRDAQKDLETGRYHPCLVEIKSGPHHRLPFVLEGDRRRSTLTPEEIDGAPYDDLDRTAFRHGYEQDTKVYDYPQSSGLKLDDEFMEEYLCAGDKDLKSYFDTRINCDPYTIEFYSRDSESGWRIHRYLLDEAMKQAVWGYYRGEGPIPAGNDQALIEYVAKRNWPESWYSEGMMTREMAVTKLR